MSAAATVGPVTLAAAGSDAAARQRAEAAGREFEAFFLSQVLEAMSAGLDTDPLFGGGAGERTFRSMLNEEFARAMAGHGGLGLADSVTSAILQLQEATDVAPANVAAN